MPRKDKAREDRITYEIVVDCYNEHEVAMGWYCHLQDNLGFPFDACIIGKSKKNPLETGQTVRVLAMADEEDCMHDMWVSVQTHEGCEYDIPLEQIALLDTSGKAQESIDDWNYWLSQGYCF